MTCEYCQRTLGHSTRCPLYSYDISMKKCAICGDYIQYGEEYIVNDYGDYAHIDCISYFRDLLNFLQVKIEIMSED